MHESMTSQKIKKLGAGGGKLGGGPKLLVGGHAPPPLATGLGMSLHTLYTALSTDRLNGK